MALIPINKPEYNLTDDSDKPVPGLEKTVFGPSSDDYLNQPRAVEFTRKQGMIPPSLLETIAVRAYSCDPKAWDRQCTRLGAFFVRDGNKVYVAFDDVPDAKKNIVIARAQEGYDLNVQGKELVVRGKTLSEVLKRAGKRILEVPEDGHVEACIEEYGENPYFIASEGHMAPVNARLIQSKGYEKGHLWMPKPAYVLEHTKKDEAVVRPVRLGGGDVYVISSVDANDNFNDNGRVRGVSGAPEFSTGNKGKLVSSAK
jgi:hypothetical protein